MDKETLQKRTKAFALRCIQLADSLPRNASGRAISSQLARSACSVGAKYRAACRARSTAEFHSKLSIVVEEADESCFWLELVIESQAIATARVQPLLLEASELTAIFVAARKTVATKSGNRQS